MPHVRWLLGWATAVAIARGDDAKLCKGPLNIPGVNGAAFAKGDGGKAAGGGLSLQHNSGFSVTTDCDQESWDPQGFTLFQLLGKTLSYVVDLSQVGCSCNLALYLIAEPALGTDGRANEKGEGADSFCDSSPYYCDANQVCGQWCPEMDIMEANNHVFSSTPHKCDPPDENGHYSSCDAAGCGANTKDLEGKSYGPGAEFKIDTTRPFEVQTSFDGDGGSSPPKFSEMKTRLVQGDNTVSLDHSSCGETTSGMADVMAKGMSMRITYWGHDADTMSWLDEPLCSDDETCDGSNAGKAVISSIRVVDGIGPATLLLTTTLPPPTTPPPPPPPPTTTVPTTTTLPPPPATSPPTTSQPVPTPVVPPTTTTIPLQTSPPPPPPTTPPPPPPPPVTSPPPPSTTPLPFTPPPVIMGTLAPPTTQQPATTQSTSSHSVLYQPEEPQPGFFESLPKWLIALAVIGLLSCFLFVCPWPCCGGQSSSGQGPFVPPFMKDAGAADFRSFQRVPRSVESPTFQTAEAGPDRGAWPPEGLQMHGYPPSPGYSVSAGHPGYLGYPSSPANSPYSAYQRSVQQQQQPQSSFGSLLCGLCTRRPPPPNSGMYDPSFLPTQPPMTLREGLTYGGPGQIPMMGPAGYPAAQAPVYGENPWPPGYVDIGPHWQMPPSGLARGPYL